MVKKTEKSSEKKAAAATAVNKGSWTSEEDRKLVDYVTAHGNKKWRTLPAKAGLNRCGKSCRLRWLNYLRPGIKRGNISEDEEDLILRLHNLIGNRWTLIAGRLPGRTDNEIKNHWNTHLSKKSLSISDLNSKLNLRLEGSNYESSVSPSPASSHPEPTTPGPSTFPVESKDEAVLPGASAQEPVVDTAADVTAAPPEVDQEDAVFGGLRVEECSDINANFETCHSPSSFWFQLPFYGEGGSGCDDVCMAVPGTMDYNHNNCLLYFPWS